MADEKTRRALEAFKAQGTKYIEALPEKKKKKKKKEEQKKKKEEAKLRRYLRLTKMAILGKHYGRKKRRIGGLYAGYGRRTVAPKTK